MSVQRTGNRPVSTQQPQQPQQTQQTQQTQTTQQTQQPQQTQQARPAQTTAQSSGATTPAVTPQSAQATTQSRTEAQTRATHDQAATQMQARVGGGHSGGDLNGNGMGLNRAGGHLRSGSGAIPSSAWDNPGPEIVGRLTQNPPRGAAGSASGASRCGPANVLAGAIMRGPDATSSMLTNVANNPQSHLSDAQRTRLREISTAVHDRRATFEQLSEAQDLMYRAGNTHQPLHESVDRVRAGGLSRLNAAERREFDTLDRTMRGPNGLTDPQAARLGELMTRATGRPHTVELQDDPQHPGDAARQEWYVRVPDGSTSSRDGGYSDSELGGLASRGGAGGRLTTMDPAAINPDGSSATFERLVGGLRPGESATVRVSGSVDGTDANHYVTVGRQPDGTPYIYNPDPDRGDHTLYVGRGSDPAHQPADFNEQLRRYGDRVINDRDGDTPSVVVSGP